MENGLFRKKSMDRINSPEELNAYVRVANPSVWVTLAVVILLLIGFSVWGFLGHLDTSLDVAIYSDGNNMICFAEEEGNEPLKEGQTVNVEGCDFTIAAVADTAVKLDESESYLLHLLGYESATWVYEGILDGALAPGYYSGKLTLDSVSPASFALN